jgi:hypothetical protein
LKGHGLSRAAKICKIDGALAAEGCILLSSETIPQRLKPISFPTTFPGAAQAMPFRFFKCDCPGKVSACDVSAIRQGGEMVGWPAGRRMI